MDIEKMCQLPGPNHIHEISPEQTETCYDEIDKIYKCAAGLTGNERRSLCCGVPALCGEF